jgi:hypothetical protein
MTTRRQLIQEEADHPRAAEEYIKVQLGGLIHLPNSIVAEGWRRLSFLYTTGDSLLRAKTLNDLVLDGEERLLLWRSIRDRADADPAFYGTRASGPTLPGPLLAELLEMISYLG